ncbi:N-acetylmuramoyl-L-alanine amidase [Geopsychrobacter electrodiphilus]|uniref:N-acetylmuramoyl-L-alanine amidase n=1 Tax=Geopsychrobacter electrodiphilus TaxID=225196 RepID=UPI0012EB4064|nr:N-acetylmuramoyl-L-alanine amidase [Geopsychrobacter electrodiphilus]
MKCTVIQFVILTLLLLSTSGAFAAEPNYHAVRAEYAALLASPRAQRQRDNWLRLVKHIESFIALNKDIARKDDAEFLLGRVWHGLSRASGRRADARKAQDLYESMARNYPNSNLADDALIAAADIALETFSDQTAAYNDYLQITTVLPPGDMLGVALSRLKRLAYAAPSIPAQSQKQPSQASGAKGKLSAIRVWNSPEYTRVVIDLNQATDYDSHQLKGSEPRIYLDFADIELAEGILATQPVHKGILRQIRSGPIDSGGVRVVLDLLQGGEFQVFNLEKPDRVVIDIRTARSSDDSAVEIKASAPAGPDSIGGILDDVPISTPPVLHVPQHNTSEGIHLIVVDAGHGGKDPGAVGRNDTFEKDITLSVALKLASALRKELKCKVLLTRSDDRFIPLHARTAYANKVGADLFISLHANASANRKAYGLETYYLNLSKNNQAAEVAARENGTSLEEVGNLEAILFDLMANAKINESSRLAAEIQQALIQQLSPKFSNIKDLGVRQGPFHVLLGATMPSVLVETAFISNRREEKRLISRAYQERVAEAIVQGVKDYSQTIKQVAGK